MWTILIQLTCKHLYEDFIGEYISTRTEIRSNAPYRSIHERVGVYTAELEANGVVTETTDFTYGADELRGGRRARFLIRRAVRVSTGTDRLARTDGGSQTGLRTCRVVAEDPDGTYSIRCTFEGYVVPTSNPQLARFSFVTANPLAAGNAFQLRGDLPAGARATLTDLTGRSLRTWKLDDGKSLTLPATTPGLHALRVQAPGYADAVSFGE